MSFRKKWINVEVSWRAILQLYSEEGSFRFQVVSGFLAVVVSLVLDIPRIEFLIVILTIALVLGIEALNTAIEELCDHVTPEQHARIGKIKDLASGATLMVNVAAAVIGLLIFLPPLWALLYP